MQTIRKICWHFLFFVFFTNSLREKLGIRLEANKLLHFCKKGIFLLFIDEVCLRGASGRGNFYFVWSCWSTTIVFILGFSSRIIFSIMTKLNYCNSLLMLWRSLFLFSNMLLGKPSNYYLPLTIQKLSIYTVSLPLFGFFFCIVLSYINNFEVIEIRWLFVSSKICQNSPK